jgi:hypothetical protein
MQETDQSRLIHHGGLRFVVGYCARTGPTGAMGRPRSGTARKCAFPVPILNWEFAFENMWTMVTDCRTRIHAHREAAGSLDVHLFLKVSETMT